MIHVASIFRSGLLPFMRHGKGPPKSKDETRPKFRQYVGVVVSQPAGRDDSFLATAMLFSPVERLGVPSHQG